ncbi:hypothetical protein GCM10023144_47450 [Pigmentiphaga soli]|uniref:KfrA N-terminal DNA-binding domain-containing protein n=1 Tax=Pigmentiphaga soli TaxID=1007095 RepID=A0ABP8HTB9_9BURK
MAVTKEQIFSAADELAAAGQKPTLEAIRQITGGSYTTISPALNEWKARQATAAQPLREPAPQAVADRLAEVGAEVWGIALELANARLASEREALDKARADLEADRAEATELADRLAAQVDDLRTELDRAHQDADQARQALAEQLAATQAERDQARQEAGKAREEAARLAGQLQAHQEQIAALLARINPAESKPASTRKKGGE